MTTMTTMTMTTTAINDGDRHPLVAVTSANMEKTTTTASPNTSDKNNNNNNNMKMAHSTRVFGLVGTGTIATTTTNNNITIINRGQVAGGHGHWSGNRSPYGMVNAAIRHSKQSNSNNNKRGTTAAILTTSESLSKPQRRQKRQQPSSRQWVGHSSTCWYEKFQLKRSRYYFYGRYVIHFPRGMYSYTWTFD